MRRQKYDDATLYSLRCEDCGHYLTRTPSGYLACPLGHGKLIRETPDDPQPADESSGLWFADDPPADRPAAA
jgi:hypothetical protein